MWKQGLLEPTLPELPSRVLGRVLSLALGFSLALWTSATWFFSKFKGRPGRKDICASQDLLGPRLLIYIFFSYPQDVGFIGKWGPHLAHPWPAGSGVGSGHMSLPLMTWSRCCAHSFCSRTIGQNHIYLWGRMNMFGGFHFKRKKKLLLWDN